MNQTTTNNPSRVYRGGGWYITFPARVRAADRDAFAPASRNIVLGFRCALRGREPGVKP